MSEVRKIGSRFWELHGDETLFVAGAIITAGTALLFPVIGAIACYFWLAFANLMLWEKDLPPFSWIKDDILNWILILLGPLTAISIVLGVCVFLMGCPIFLWHNAQKAYRWQLRQIAEDVEDNEYAAPVPPRLKNYLVGGAIYYVCLAAALFGMWTYIQAHI